MYLRERLIILNVLPLMMTLELSDKILIFLLTNHAYNNLEEEEVIQKIQAYYI